MSDFKAVLYAVVKTLTKASKSQKEQSDYVSADLESLHEWFMANWLSVNVSETYYM